jgi:hypothetical protein
VHLPYTYAAAADAHPVADVHLSHADADAVDSASQSVKLFAAKPGPVGDDFVAACAERDGERDQHRGSDRRRWYRRRRQHRLRRQ